MDLDVLRLKAKPSCDPKTRKRDELFVYEVKYPRRPELVNNQHISGIVENKEDSLVAYVLPQNMQWPTFLYAHKQQLEAPFNNNILLTRNDPLNNTRLQMSIDNLIKGVDLNDETSIWAWVGSPGIGKVRIICVTSIQVPTFVVNILNFYFYFVFGSFLSYRQWH